MFLTLFIPYWENSSAIAEINNNEQPYSVHPKSKYRLQSTPDIILNELLRHNINTGGIKIVSGINIHDLKKRVRILNPQISDEKISHLVESARETAFTTKYATPREDEKLVNINELKIQGIKEWFTYLYNFLSKLNIRDQPSLI